MEQAPSFFAFVLMPFSPAFDDIYKLGIKETAESIGLIAQRVDEQIYQDSILERIYRQIDVADLIIADMSGQNPNVFYEVGYAHAKGKLCVLITKDQADIPFDLKHHRHIIYGSSITDLKKQLKLELEWAKTQINAVRSSRIKVSLKSASGNLEKFKYLVKGEVSFTIDMVNETSNESPELDAVYIYLGKGWRLSQDDKECSWTDSDIPSFIARHFLTPPLRRLNKSTWAQLKFTASKVLAHVVEGEEIKDEYHLTGKMLVRLVTREGNFDYELPVDVKIDDLPF
jgi:nucleoside 2-deoxyribosyltransferase